MQEDLKIKRPLLMHLASEDEFMDKAAQATIIKELSNNPYIKIYTYPGRKHAFARPNGDHYNAKAAETANASTLAFFKQHLKNRS